MMHIMKISNILFSRHTGELHEFLEQCDYIVNVMPSTPDTRGMLGRNALKHAKYLPIYYMVDILRLIICLKLAV